MFFLDCVAIDDLKDEEFLSELCDRLRIGSFLIFNVDPKSKAGIHWVLLVRLSDGSLFIFDSFGARMTNETFHFKNFAFEERDINKLYDPNTGGQLFQFVQNDLTYANNKFHSFIFSKQHFRSYSRPNNATVPLFHFLRFLNRLCPRKQEHRVYYCMSQLQPFETIICGELCILVAEILYRSTHCSGHNSPPKNSKCSHTISFFKHHYI